MLDKPPYTSLKNEDIISIMKEADVNGILLPLVNKYAYWDEVKYKSGKHKPEELWAAIKFYRKTRYTHLTFGKYKFRFMVTDRMQELLHEFDINISGSFNSNIGINKSNHSKFLMNSIMEEAISSSQIEGAATTRRVAKKMIRQEKKPKNKSEQMIFNNFFTMQEIVERKKTNLTTQKIRHLHHLMTEDTLENKADEGQFRTNNDIKVVNHSKGEIVHIPPSFKEIEELMNDLCHFFNHNSHPFIHPIIKACIIHFLIGWIHPFVDGNGRTARALFYWYMLRKGYWLTEYLSISLIIQKSKIRYEKAYLYTENDGNDMGYFISYHLQTMEKAFKALIRYINTKQKEVSKAASFMRIAGVNERMSQIIKLLDDDGDSILNAKELSGRFNVSDFTSRKDLKSLEELGFVDVVQVNKQKKNYIKSKQFEKLIANIDK